MSTWWIGCSPMSMLSCILLLNRIMIIPLPTRSLFCAPTCEVPSSCWRPLVSMACAFIIYRPMRCMGIWRLTIPRVLLRKRRTVPPRLIQAPRRRVICLCGRGIAPTVWRLPSPIARTITDLVSISRSSFRVRSRIFYAVFAPNFTATVLTCATGFIPRITAPLCGLF